MFNCYDTILQQQQRRSRESNKCLTRGYIFEVYLKVIGLKTRMRRDEMLSFCLRGSGSCNGRERRCEFRYKISG